MRSFQVYRRKKKHALHYISASHNTPPPRKRKLIMPTEKEDKFKYVQSCGLLLSKLNGDICTDLENPNVFSSIMVNLLLELKNNHEYLVWNCLLIRHEGLLYLNFCWRINQGISMTREYNPLFFSFSIFLSLSLSSPCLPVSSALLFLFDYFQGLPLVHAFGLYFSWNCIGTF